MNDRVNVPTIPPTVTTSGSATLPMQNTLVDDDHDVVEHATVPSRPDGVESLKAKFTPITERLLVPCVAATLVTDARALTLGAEEAHAHCVDNTKGAT